MPLSATPEQERYGFQIEWARPLTHALPIDWEILRPARSQAGLPIPAQAEVGREELASGQSQFRKVFSFGAAAPLGTWNFRVLVDRHLVLDRAIEVYEPSAQRRVSKNPG